MRAGRRGPEIRNVTMSLKGSRTVRVPKGVSHAWRSAHPRWGARAALHEYLRRPQGLQAESLNAIQAGHDAGARTHTICSNASCSTEEGEGKEGRSIGRSAEAGRDRSLCGSARRAAAEAHSTAARHVNNDYTSCSSGRRCCSWCKGGRRVASVGGEGAEEDGGGQARGDRRRAPRRRRHERLARQQRRLNTICSIVP